MADVATKSNDCSQQYTVKDSRENERSPGRLFKNPKKTPPPTNFIIINRITTTQPQQSSIKGRGSNNRARLHLSVLSETRLKEV